MKTKYSIFHIEGGIGKHIAATAVARCIKNNHPDRKLIVVCAWTSPFVNLDFVDRVYNLNNVPYFYDNYIRNKDSLIFKHEPYFTTDHIHGSLPLIENWCKLYELEYNNETPELVFNMREKQLAYEFWMSDSKPLMVMQPHGGLFGEENVSSYKWTRDMPYGIIDSVVDEFHKDYNIFYVTRPNTYVPENVFVVNQQYSVMELATILTRSSKRLLIDSFLQHAAAALNIHSTVLWIGTNPNIFGYNCHDNIIAKPIPNFKLPGSYLFDYDFYGITYECPYKTEEEMFDTQEIIDSVKKQGLN